MKVERKRAARASAFRPAVRGSVTTPLRGEVSGLGKGKKSADPRDFFSQAIRSARSVYRGADRGLSLLPRLRISHPPPRLARHPHDPATQPQRQRQRRMCRSPANQRDRLAPFHASPARSRALCKAPVPDPHTHTAQRSLSSRARRTGCCARSTHTARGPGAATPGYVSENPLRKQGSRSLAWILMR